jgi:uncharacterized protein YneF (UPF0154 family)
MGAPPAFNPPQRQSSSKLWLWLLLIVVAFCVVCVVGVFFAGKAMVNMGVGMASCAMNGDMARNAVVAYAMETGKMPSAEAWQDDILPYYQRIYDKHAGKDVEDAPEWLNFNVAKPGEILGCEMSSGFKTGFAFNSKIAGMAYAELQKDPTTVVIWETLTPAYNASGDPATRPKDHESLKLFGEKRNWLDFPLVGEAELLESGDSDFDINIRPEDGLPGKGPAPDPNKAASPTS